MNAVHRVPKIYPCSQTHLCENGCCHPPVLFNDDEAFLEHSKSPINAAPTMLSSGKYRWQDDSVIKHRAPQPYVKPTTRMQFQESDLQPPVFSRSKMNKQ